MEMLSSFRGDKHEFCLVIKSNNNNIYIYNNNKFKHVRSCPSFDITYT